MRSEGRTHLENVFEVSRGELLQCRNTPAEAPDGVATKCWDLAEPGNMSATTLQHCQLFEDLPGIKLLDGTPSQHVQQTEKVAGNVPSKTKFVIV